MEAIEESEPGLVALIDLDGTLANYDKAIRMALESIRHPNEPTIDPEDLHDDDKAWLRNRKKLIRCTPNFWRNLETIPRGFEVLDALRKLDFRLMVLTKGPSTATNAWTEKILWCREHLPDAQVTVTEGDKGSVAGHVLFDDWPPYFRGWLTARPKGLVIMLDHPHNEGFEHPNVFRYRSSALDHAALFERLLELREQQP
jgi:5'(3')-deoxyribonucleotidase